MPVAKILLRWVFWNTIAGSLGALLGAIVLIAILDLTKDPDVRRNGAVLTVTFLSLYALPSAVFAAAVSFAQRRMIIPFHHIGGWWIGASAVGSGVGALLGLGLIAMRGSASTKALSFVFGASAMSAALSLGIGLGLGVAQWLYLRGLRLAFLWVAANLVGIVAGDFTLGWTASLLGRNRPIILVVAQGVLAWLAASFFTGGTLVYLLKPWQEATDKPLVNAQSAAKRTLCLAALVYRGQTEHRGPEAGDLPSADMNTKGQDFAALQVRWMKQQGLWKTASVRERALFEKPLDSWQKQEILDTSWRTEALGVLIWALNSSTDFPPYDRMVHETNIEANIRELTLPRDARTFIAGARLRDVREIRKARDVAEFWLWRARTTQLQNEHVAPPEGMTFEGTIAEAARVGERDGLFTAIDNDFPALDRSYATLSETEWSRMRSIAGERLYALNWLCGYSDDWDNVSTGT